MKAAIILFALSGACAAQQPLGQVRSSDAAVRGAVSIGKDGTTVMSGSQITAGATPATVEFASGGDLRVCPGTSITITASASGRERLIGLNSGAVEAHYTLSSSADTVITPDFRILLAGPGAFHLAISANQRGDTCIQTKAGDTAGIIVNELMSEGTYQVKPGDAVLFRQGKVSGAAQPEQPCGCAPAARLAEAERPADPAQLAAAKGLGFPESESQRAAEAIARGEKAAAQPAPAPAAGSSEPATLVDAPIVFKETVKTPAKKVEEPVTAPAAKPESSAPAAEPKPAEKPKKKWFERMGAAIKGWFGKK